MTVSNRKLSENNLSQEIDLGELLGRSPTSSEASAFQEQLLEVVIKRTQGGRDIDGDKFKNYNEEYAEKKGVGVSDVDLTLFGDMLLSMETERVGDKIRLQIDGDEAGKAYGHVSGFKGHPTIKNGPRRDFFGVSDNEAKQIADSISEGDGISSIANLFAARQAREQSGEVERILNNIGIFADNSGGLFG